MRKKSIGSLLFLLLWIFSLCGCERIETPLRENQPFSESPFSTVYEAAEFLDDTQYSAYMDDDGTLFSRLLAFQDLNMHAASYEFFPFGNNFIEIVSEKIPADCRVNHGTPYEAESRYEVGGETITATEAIQISDNFFSLFPVEISSGRSLEKKDFEALPTQSVPILLGDAYRGVFALGDTLTGYFICERRTFTVVGFIAPGSSFYLRSQNALQSYDRFIVMPFDNASTDSYAARAVLLQRLCGFLRLREDRSAALREIRANLKATGLEAWTNSIIINEKSLQEKSTGMAP